MRLVVGLVLVLALSAGALALPWPFAWIYGLWAAFFLACAVRVRARALKLAALCCFAPALLCLGAEVYLLRDPEALTGVRTEGTYHGSQDVWAPHDVLGYAPLPGLSVDARRTVHGQQIYHAHYRYDAHGLRVTPPVEGGPPLGAVLCFGGSFTLGEGVDDEQSYPYRVGELSGRRYEVRNFGYHGYGPHHALAALQAGLVEPTITSAPVLALYGAIPDHAPRVAGRKAWDTRGPWYEVEDGRPVRRGRFDARPGLPLLSRERAVSTLRRSALVSRLRPEPYQLLGSDFRVWEAVVLGLRDAVAERFPGARFVVIAWEDPYYGQRPCPWSEALARLAAAGVEVHHVRDMLPDLASGAPLPTLPHDPHPTGAVLEAIARHVVERLLPRG